MCKVYFGVRVPVRECVCVCVRVRVRVRSCAYVVIVHCSLLVLSGAKPKLDSVWLIGNIALLCLHVYY